MTTLNQYQVYCVTDNKWVTVWNETAPTTCPENNTHSIDLAQTTIVQVVSTNTVKIVEEAVTTGSHFQTTTLTVSAPPNSSGTGRIYWPFNITALEVNFTTGPEHQGDILNMYGGKDLIVGAITTAVAPASTWTSQNYVVGDKVIYTDAYHTGPRVYTCITNTVSNNLPVDVYNPTRPENLPYWKHGYAVGVTDSVLAATAIGFYVGLFDGVNSTDMGRVISVDKVGKIVYLENNPTNSHSPASPTYFRQTTWFIKNYIIDHSWERDIGSSKIGGASVPKNVYIEAHLTNNSNTTTHTINGHCEFLY